MNNIENGIYSYNEDITNLETNKQDALTFDQTPTAESTNPVTSGGVKTALDSVDTEIGELKSALRQSETHLIAIESGTFIDANGALKTVNAKRLRNVTQIPVYDLYSITLPDGYSGWFFRLDKNGEHISAYNGWLSGTVALASVITAETEFVNIAIRKTASPNDDISADAATVEAGISVVYKSVVELEAFKEKIDGFLNLGDVTLIPGFAVSKWSGKIVELSNYSYAEINVSVLVGSTFTGVSGASDANGLAFYDVNGDFISGFGNPVAGTYNWSVSGTVPDRAVLMRVSCRESHYSQFALHFNWNKTMVDIANGIAETQENTEQLKLIDKALSWIFIPKLRNGSAGNAANANSVSTQYIYPIDFTKEKIVVEYLGDTSLANQYAWGYCLFRGATDGMLSTAAFADSSITKYNYNGNATERFSAPKYELPTTKAVNYDHIMFYLFRYNDDTIVPLRIATDQYNFRITLKEKDGEQSQRDIDLAETKHDLLFAKHAKNNTGPQLTLLHFSDLHADTVALARILKDAEGIEYDDAICTGDIVGNSADRIESWWDESVLTCIGNHDSASYNSTDGYNWVALSMADRDAYYITPFKSKWGGVVHTSGKSYYYKDYADAKVRLIVMDAMLYSVYESDTSLGTAQTAWLNSLLSSAISNNLHVLIAIHAPHGGATAEDCSFSRYNQAEMPTYNDCNTPQSIIDAVATAIGNGLHFIGYLVGHTHQDNVWDAEGDGKQLMYCITCAAVSNVNQWKASDQHRDEENDAYNIVVVDTTNTLVKLIRGGGANMDDHMRTRRAICINYSNGTVVGEVL